MQRHLKHALKCGVPELFLWVSIQVSCRRRRVVDGGDGLQIWKGAVNILNNQLRTADKRWSSSLGSWARG